MSRNYDSRISSATAFCKPHEFCAELIKNGDSPRSVIMGEGAVFTTSAAVLNCSSKETKTIAVGDEKCFAADSQMTDESTIFNVASISKVFASATLLRMIESEKYREFFPRGVETPVEHFLSYLKLRYAGLDYVQTALQAEPHFSEMTLLNLLNHTSGLGNFDKDDFKKLRFESEESLKLEPDGKFFSIERAKPRPEFGKHSYSDCGYELLAMIVSSIASNQANRIVKYGEVVRDLVVEPLGLRHTFTPDQMHEIDGKVVVASREDLRVAQAKDFNPELGQLIPSRVFCRSIGGATALYSTPSDVCEFFSNFCEGKLFSSEFFSPLYRVECGKPNEYYGIGHFVYQEEGAPPKIFHGATTVGFFGHVRYDALVQKAACVLNATQNLSTKFLAEGENQALGSKRVSEECGYDERLMLDRTTRVVEGAAAAAMIGAERRVGII